VPMASILNIDIVTQALQTRLNRSASLTASLKTRRLRRCEKRNRAVVQNLAARPIERRQRWRNGAGARSHVRGAAYLRLPDMLLMADIWVIVMLNWVFDHEMAA